MKRYLAVDGILPGDIILSAAQTFRSFAIRVSTGTRIASHAAIAIHPLMWFEAIGRGVGYQVISPKLIWDGSRIRLAMEIPKGETYAVRRPKDCLCKTGAPVERYVAAKELIAVSSRYAFLNYARPEAFLRSLRFGLGESAFARFVINNLDKKRKTFYPGQFCSWLVAECYKDLGKKIFDKEPNTITPGALARSRDLLPVDLSISGTPYDIPPRFSNIDRDLRVSVALTIQNLSSLTDGALLQKVVTGMNYSIREKLGYGWSLLGMQLPIESKNAFDAINDQAHSSFREWQAMVIGPLELAYPGLSYQTEQIDHLNRCYEKCLKPTAGLLCGQMGRCSIVTEGLLKTMTEIHQVFPRPPILKISDFSGDT